MNLGPLIEIWLTSVIQIKYADNGRFGLSVFFSIGFLAGGSFFTTGWTLKKEVENDSIFILQN